MSTNGNEFDECFASGGECGAIMRNTHWEDTELGPAHEWPPTLRTLIPIMLASRFAMRILWGAHLILFYNDEYRHVLGSRKHPAAMGRPVQERFHEVWDTVGPLFARVLEGESAALEDRLLALNRSGYLEECYFTLSYSPIPDDKRNGGPVIGVLGVVHETTERVLASAGSSRCGNSRQRSRAPRRSKRRAATPGRHSFTMAPTCRSRSFTPWTTSLTRAISSRKSCRTPGLTFVPLRTPLRPRHTRLRHRDARSSIAIEAAELALIVEGIEPAGARRRPRWQPAALPA